MRKIITPCAFCQKSIAVGFWGYLPSKTPVDIYCPQCHGRNNINRVSIFVSLAAWLSVGSLGWAMTPTSWGSGKAGFWPFILLSALLGAWPAAFIGSRIPGLVKYARWWIRSAPIISDTDSELMSQLGVEHNGQYFTVGDMHFDHLREALTYARNRSSSAA
jgi:hypothetical protein